MPITRPSSTPLAPEPFYNTTLGFSAPEGQPLPSLDLQRVFVLTGEESCSASELIMNGLRGIDFEVIQIGSTTCGKPYGFYGIPNCGEVYFTIQFQGVNEKGFGDYTDGFSPQNTVGAAGVLVPGCSVADDYDAGFGDTTEDRFAAALAYRDTQSCPTPTGTTGGVASKPTGDFDSILLVPPEKNPLRSIRIMRL